MDTPQAAPVITLTTDFGLTDHYVGTMKGVILARCPRASIVDISHGVPAFSVIAGAYTIAQAAPYFPRGTVHVVVIDPGVGTARKALVVEALDQTFIAPDNGVLSLIAFLARDVRVHEITNQALFLPNVSSTFHGRDVFAAVAGALATGIAPAELGPRASNLELLRDLVPRPSGERSWKGVILSVDHFGNVITNFAVADFAGIEHHAFAIRLADDTVQSFYPTFGKATRNEYFAYFGSSGYVEIGLKEADAAAQLRIRPGGAVEITLDR